VSIGRRRADGRTERRRKNVRSVDGDVENRRLSPASRQLRTSENSATRQRHVDRRRLSGDIVDVDVDRLCDRSQRAGRDDDDVDNNVGSAYVRCETTEGSGRLISAPTGTTSRHIADIEDIPCRQSWIGIKLSASHVFLLLLQSNRFVLTIQFL